jgi:hypothetical protein
VSASQDFRIFLDELDEAGICEAEKSAGWLEGAQRSKDIERQVRAYSIQRAADAREKISFRRRASDAGHGVRIWNGKSADAGVEMEQDFTSYNGTPGRLKCPLVAPKKRKSLINVPLVNGTNGMNGHRTPRGSSMSRGSLCGRRSKRSSFHDPIRAEICGLEQPASGAPSIEGSAPLCPIRFLDQHSPEEVAQYFEKHKHELPRSHEICVKRYQSNEASIRELDARYGSLVTMIQGLGQVHQPMLPETPDDELDEEGGDVDPKDRVQKWATTVSESLRGVDEALDRTGNEEDRQPHFDRPLKDVRVGESPSRPWGITVPDGDTNDTAARSDHTASPRETPLPGLPDEVAKGKCPFDHKKMKLDGMQHLMPPTPAQTKPTQSSLQAETGHPSAPRGPEPAQEKAQKAAPPPQIVFNGPVFFGYNMDQAVAMLQQNNLGKP